MISGNSWLPPLSKISLLEIDETAIGVFLPTAISITPEVTTTASNSAIFTSIATSIIDLAPIATSCVMYPTALKVRVLPISGIFKSKDPLKLVIVPILVSLITILTPGKPSLFSSSTLPDKLRSCASTARNKKLKDIVNKNFVPNFK